jgi:hypothetical protein
MLLQGLAHAASDVAVELGGNEPTSGAVNPLSPQNVVLAKCSLVISTDLGRTFPSTVNVETSECAKATYVSIQSSAQSGPASLFPGARHLAIKGGDGHES